MIFHIASKSVWEAAIGQGVYSPESVSSEGFIHCVTLQQLVFTANRKFRGQQGIAVLCIAVPLIRPPVRYESSEEGIEAFPHIYGPLNLDAVVRTTDLVPRADGTFVLPTEVARLAGEQG